MIEIVESGWSTTVQDRGRAGWAALGVPRSGALDVASYERANALVGNRGGEATLEVTGGGLTLRSRHRHVVAVTGADCPGTPMDVALTLDAGDELRLRAPEYGLRSYVAVAGGIEVPTVLGSRSWDQLSRLGPPPLQRGDTVGVGEPPRAPAAVGGGVPPRTAPTSVRVWVGPRADMVVDALPHLTARAWRVADAIDRIGLRLTGSPLHRVSQAELPSEGLVTGAVQVPHDGRPIVMLADHPTTGGYPVVAVVDPSDLDLLAHLRPGDLLRFTVAPAVSTPLDIVT